MLRALVGIGLVQVVTMVLYLVRTKGLALLLGPDQVGIMGVIDKAVALVVQTMSLSLPFAAVRFLPAAWEVGPERWTTLYRQMRRVLLALVLPAAIAALVVAIVAPHWWGNELAGYGPILAASAATIPALALVPFLQNAVAGRLQQYRAMLVSLGYAAVSAVAVIGAWWWGLRGFYLVLALLGTGLAAPLAWWLGRRHSGPAPTKGDPAMAGLPRRVWRFSGTMFLLAVTVPYAALFVHYTVLRHQAALGAGWMQAALGIALAVRVALGAAHGVFLTPNINRGGPPEERMRWADGFQETFCRLVLLVVPPILLFPGLAVRVLYSSAFLPGAPFVALFVTAEILGLLAGTYQSLIVALDHLRFHVVQNLVAQGVVVGLAVWLVAPLGLLGAGLAWLGAPVLMLATTVIFLRRAHGLRVGARAQRLGVGLAAAMIVAGLVGTLTAVTSPLGILLRGVVLGGVLTSTIRGMTTEEWGRVRALVPGWGR